MIIEYILSALSYLAWMLICFIEVVSIPFILAFVVQLMRPNNEKHKNDSSSVVEKVASSMILILFPPLAIYEYGMKKALITLFIQFVGFIAAFSLLILIDKMFNLHVDLVWYIILIAIISWGGGILYAVTQKKKYSSQIYNE